jgi:hypothetical protein
MYALLIVDTVWLKKHITMYTLLTVDTTWFKKNKVGKNMTEQSKEHPLVSFLEGFSWQKLGSMRDRHRS